MADVLSVAESNENTVIWLGAGFTRCVTAGKAPLMAGFFDELIQLEYPQLYGYLLSHHNSKCDANIETVLQHLDQLADAPISSKMQRDILAGYDLLNIRMELERYCMRRLSSLDFDAHHWAVGILASATSKTTVITTNYDVIADRILQRRANATHCRPDATCHHCNMMRLLRDECECPPWKFWKAGQNAFLLKLHGSIAWHICKNKTCSVRDCLQPHCDCSPAIDPRCGCCREASRPVIVLPSRNKRYSEFKEIKRMWEKASDALQTCTTLTTFGFSFPESDCLIRDIVRRAFSLSTMLQRIIVIDVDPKAVIERLEPLIPASARVIAYPLAVPKDGSEPDWLLNSEGHATKVN